MSEAKLTKKQVDYIKHSLGISQGDKPYRNYFTTGKDSDNYDVLMDMVKQGVMTCRKAPFDDFNNTVVFHVTDLGCKFVGLTGLDAINK